MVKVVHVLEALTGGAARHLFELLDGLDEFQTTAIVSPLRDPEAAAALSHYESRGIRIIRCPMRREIHPARDLQALRTIAHHLQAIEPQIVHCHTARAGFLGRLAAHLAGVPAAIYTPHGLPFCAGFSPSRRRLYERLERLAGRWTSRLVAVSPSEADMALQAALVPPCRVRVIPNGVEIPSPVDRDAARQTLGFPTDRPVVLCLAHTRPQKAPLDWIEMARRVARRQPDVLFVWAGWGELDRELDRTASAALPGAFVHLRPPWDSRLLYAAADIFTLSSHWEACPYSLLDAMAAGLPCAATEVAGCREALAGTGALSPAGDPQAMADQVIALLCDPAMARARGARLREVIRNRYTPDEFLRRHRQLYAEVTDRR